MEVLIASAAAIVVGLATGQFVTIGLKGSTKDPELTRRIERVEKVLPDYISRTEVQEVINKVPPLVAQQVQSELTTMAAQLTAQIPVQQPPVPAQMPPMPAQFEELNRQNVAKMQELEARIQEASSPIQPPVQTQMSLPQMEALQKQMKPRNRKPRQ
jgi:uncharacterized protein YneF (UPF0154 family)|tara:strand:+ start:172 stop:642 length:471 start_codon:yes stop_codon:yes gene_type:complete